MEESKRKVKVKTAVSLKRLELHSAAPRATLTPLSCSPNFPRAQYFDIRTLTHELIVQYYIGVLLPETYMWEDTPIYANEIMKFQIWPSAIVGVGSFWNYQSKVTPDSKEFAMMIDTQRKASRYVRFIEQLIIVLT